MRIPHCPGCIPYGAPGPKQPRFDIKKGQPEITITNNIYTNSSHLLGVHCLPGTAPGPSLVLTLTLTTTTKVYIPQRERPNSREDGEKEIR